MITRVKGTRDILDLRLINYLKQKVSTHLKKYYFSEIETPIIEHLELFKRSLGTETDVVSKEMYLVTTEHESDEHLCLRPEATASTVRAYFNNNIEAQPWKVFATGPMFRHERPQKGRYRQFTQTTVELLGGKSIAHDVQLITMLDRLFMHELELADYALLVNFLGCAQDRQVFKIELQKFLDQHSSELCATCLIRKDKNSLRVFDCKNENCQKLYKKAPEIINYLCESCTVEWQQLQNQLTQLSVTFSYAPHLVRGLDYYDKTVFEFVSLSLGAQNTFCGGGRYDGLARVLGASKDLPAIGAALGIERVVALLEEKNIQLPAEPALHVLMPMSLEQQTLALLLADTLQAAGLCVEVLLEGDSLKSMMRKANKLGAKTALILGSEEQQTRTVTVKFLTSGQEEKVAQIDLVKRLTI